MEYYVEQPKKIFSYTLTLDEVITTHTDMSEDYLNELNLSDKDKEQLKKDYNRFQNQLVYYEKKWVNKILSLTDFMMIEDATYDKQTIRDTFMYEEVKQYRKELREYKDNIRTQDRPIRPNWLII